MKKNFYRNLACMLIFTGGLCMSTNTEAQVTVGSKGVPNQGALLDMKQEDKADGSANSKKGLGLPRVALTAVDKLDPCVATTGIAATDDAAKKSHIGLTVYNTTDNTAGAATLSEGVYAWDGAMWTQYSGTTAGGAENGLSMSGKKVILGGSLNRPTTITGDATNNLTLNTPTSVGSTLGVTGATTLGSTLGVTGATTLTGNLTSNGTTTLKATNISGATTIASTGSLTLAGNGAGAGKVLTSFDATGKATWQTPTYESTTASNGVSLSGKDVQLGGALTKNTLITGTNTLGLNVPTTVGSTLAVTGATTLGSTLGVTGATTLGSTLGVTGATTLTGNLTSNGTTALKATNISGATTIASTGSLTLAGNGAAAGKVLTSSDATGKATWQTPTYESTTASNGVSLFGKDVQLGGALTKNTLITGTNTLGLNVPTTVGSTLAVTGATTLGSTLGVSGVTSLKNTNVTGNLTVSGNTKTATSTVTGNETVGGTLAIAGATTIANTGSLTLAGNGAAAGKVLTSDTNGKGTWTVPVVNGAANGTQVVSNKVELGGALTKGTTIAQANNSLVITSTNTSTSSATFGTNNAALNLTANNKGFMPPRVALKGNTDNTTIPLTTADKGMVVYHTNNAVMEEGLYSWNGGSWKQLITQIPEVPSTKSNISFITSEFTTSYTDQYNSSNAAITMPFQNIAIAENGSYAFSLRLYGNITMNNVAWAPTGRNVYYVFLYKIVGTTSTLLDSAELNFYLPANTGEFLNTYSVTLAGANIKAGDNIVIKISGGGSKYSTWTFRNLGGAAQTSMAYWKL